jgi:hypothetical protein
LEWHDKTQAKPTKEEVQKAIDGVKLELAATEYRQLRARVYPPIGDQLDDLFKQGLFSKEMSDKLQAVKDRYPKL